jgi:hypothetical protein
MQIGLPLVDISVGGKPTPTVSIILRQIPIFVAGILHFGIGWAPSA